MALADVWGRLFRKHRDVRSFEHDVAARGGVVGMVDRGYKEVPVERIVGSVSRWRNLRSDFFYRTGKVTGRFLRVGEAMRQGKALPPLELYKVKPKGEPSQYYVVDGHHRVAMAKQLDQGEVDAHVVEHRVAGERPEKPKQE
ncbi:MAG TPA: hypothetical protein VG370_06830 [Chloroflexota bacterium]|nr:hypothetical protein [Chloroflexota bacterium]